VAGGCAKPCTTGNTANGLMTLVGNITSLVPGSAYWAVPYTGSSTEAASDSPGMVAQAVSYMKTCPKTPVVFLGYSLGGIIIMNTMCGGITGPGIPPGFPQIIAAITYGEETYVGGQSYDAGTCTNSAPNFARNVTGNPCATYASVLKDFCDAPDPAVSSAMFHDFRFRKTLHN